MVDDYSGLIQVNPNDFNIEKVRVVEAVAHEIEMIRMAADYTGLGNTEAVVSLELLKRVQDALTAKDERIAELEAALNAAFDFLGGVDDAAEIRGVILAALTKDAG